MKLLILGAGAWGTALAISAAARHRVTLWARDGAHVQAMQADAVNARYLPGVALPQALALCSTPAAALASLASEQDLVLIATPMAALRSMLALLRDIRTPQVWLCKGLEPGAGALGGWLGHEIAAQVTGTTLDADAQADVGVLSGPSFALEVARGQPTALVAASASAALRELLVTAFHSPQLRVYANDDVVGVEVGGAVKNVLAIATGLCDGLALGQNARAALITRGLAEMTRLGLALGARADTFMGLSGLGDLVLTATGDLSRNRRVGQLLAQGQSAQQAVAALGHVAEGVHCARAVAQRADALGVQMPIAQAVVQLLDARLQPAQALAALMAREPVREDWAAP